MSKVGGNGFTRAFPTILLKKKKTKMGGCERNIEFGNENRVYTRDPICFTLYTSAGQLSKGAGFDSRNSSNVTENRLLVEKRLVDA